MTLSRRFEPEIVVSYREVERVVSADHIQHDLVRKAILQYDLPGDHFEVHIIASLPGAGTGLGSSSALAVALVSAARAWHGTLWGANPEDIAIEAWRLERLGNGARVGLQDHSAAAFGGLHRYEFAGDVMLPRIAAHKPRLAACDFSWLLSRLMLFYIGGRVNGTREIMAGMAVAPDVKREERLSAIAAQAEIVWQALHTQDWISIGKAIDGGWRMKRELLAGITTPEIDAAYDAAIVNGAVGAKLCGAGGGGFLLICAGRRNQPKIRVAMDALGHKELRFSIAEPVF